MKVQMITILSCDPGSRNFGWSILEGKKVTRNGRVKITFRILANGMCPCPISQVKGSKELKDAQKAYQDWILGLVKKYNVDAICAERFMTRGLLGPLVEMVGIMIGIAMSCTGELPFKVFPAATWKNAVKRNTGEKDFLNSLYKKTKVLPHQLDAALMGVWTLYQGYKQTDFKGLDLDTEINKLLDQIEATSTERLINRKIER